MGVNVAITEHFPIFLSTMEYKDTESFHALTHYKIVRNNIYFCI